MQLANGITAAAGWMDMAVDPSLEIVGLSGDGWEAMDCFEIVSDVTDFVHVHANVIRSEGAVRERILKAQRQFGLNRRGSVTFSKTPSGRSCTTLGLLKHTNRSREFHGWSDRTKRSIVHNVRRGIASPPRAWSIEMGGLTVARTPLWVVPLSSQRDQEAERSNRRESLSSVPVTSQWHAQEGADQAARAP